MRRLNSNRERFGWRRRFLGCFHPIQDRSLDHGEIKSPQFRLCDSDHNPIRLIECGPEASVALARYDRSTASSSLCLFDVLKPPSSPKSPVVSAKNV